MQKSTTTIAFLTVLISSCGEQSPFQEIGRSDDNVVDQSGGQVRSGTGPRTGFSGSATGGTPVSQPNANIIPECGPFLARIRDFRESHPDFELPGGEVLQGIVEANLGIDRKPVYARSDATVYTSNSENFEQWYRDIPGVNLGFDIEIPTQEVSSGIFVYDSSAFFPIDGRGFGNEGRPHNYHFTTEIHTNFTYHGGELFTFAGDDDLWIFVNGYLAIDLGGIHERAIGTIDFDAMAGAFGIETGNTYAMDVFHAERHVVESNFHIETSISCFVPTPLK